MIRKYSLKNEIKSVNKILRIVKNLPKIASNTFYINGEVKQYFYNDFSQIQQFNNEILSCLPDCLYKPSSEIQILITLGSIGYHKDNNNKRFILIPIQCNTNVILFEENQEVIIEPLKIYTLNDYNNHGLITKNLNSKTIFIAID